MDQALVSRITRVRSGHERLNQRLVYERQGIVRLQAKVKQLEEDKAMLVKAVGLIDRCIQLISANGIGTIESVVSAGLRLSFDDPSYGFIVEKKEGARGISYALLIRKDDVSGPPMDTVGGGAVNVAAFLLRVLLIKRFKLAKFLAVDESFNNVNGAAYKRNTSELLHKLCAEHGFTILAVTGDTILTSAADRVYSVSTEDGHPVLHKRDSSAAETEDIGRDRRELPGDDPSVPSSVA